MLFRSVGTGTGNPRAAAVVWQAGKDSLLDDVTFPGGLGNLNGGAPGRGGGPAVNTRNSQAGDLIIQDGGGGIFRGGWPHDPNAKIGLRVANTTTPGTIYQMSVEHHYRVEVEFHDVKNWNILALQT